MEKGRREKRGRHRYAEVDDTSAFYKWKGECCPSSRQYDHLDAHTAPTSIMHQQH